MSVKVSLMVVNWNGKELLQESLQAIRKQVFQDYEVIVVDNGSTDGSVFLLKESFPEVKIMELDNNHGFAGGNLAGLKLCQGEYIALLNNDALPDPNWLGLLVEVMENSEETGICASRIMVADTDLLDAAGDGYATAGFGFKRGNGNPSRSFMKKENVFGASAGAVLYRRSMIEQIGFFDPDFFIVNEDTDLNFRAQLMGWKCVYVPESVVFHKVSMTRKLRSQSQVYYKIRNTDFVLIINMPLMLILRFFPHIILGQLFFVVKYALIRGYWRAVFRAKRDTLKMLPDLLGKRRKIQKMKSVSNAYLRSIFQNVFKIKFVKEYFSVVRELK